MPEKQKFIAFSCTHCPLQDGNAIEWLLGKISKERPDYVIHLGDLHEADSASRWNSDYRFTLEDEWKAANQLLGDIWKAYKPARRILLKGNHDDNFQQPDRYPEEIRGALDFTKYGHETNLEHWSKPIEYKYRRENVFRLGQAAFWHGFGCSKFSGMDEALYAAYPFGVLIGGHTHRPTRTIEPVIVRNQELPYSYANAGCMCLLDPPYMSRNKVVRWGHACVVGEVNITKSPRYSKQFDARVDILRMAENTDWN